MRAALVVVQALTFVGCALLFYAEGNWRLGTAQALLAIVTGVVYI